MRQPRGRVPRSAGAEHDAAPARTEHDAVVGADHAEPNLHDGARVRAVPAIYAESKLSQQNVDATPRRQLHERMRQLRAATGAGHGTRDRAERADGEGAHTLPPRPSVSLPAQPRAVRAVPLLPSAV